MLDQTWRNRAGVDHRVAPVIQSDQLGEQLGAKPVTIAADAIDLQRLAHHATATLAGSAIVRQHRR